MGKFYLGLTLALLLIVGGLYYLYIKTGYNFGLDNSIFIKGTITFSSQDILGGQDVPVRYTCDGDNVSPPFFIDRVPGDAKSLVLIVDDPTAPKSTFTHYILFNIDPNSINIDADIVPNSATVATNDFGNAKYEGPCLTSGKHKYYFRIFALDTTLSITESSKRTDVVNAMQGHILGKGEFFASYSR